MSVLRDSQRNGQQDGQRDAQSAAAWRWGLGLLLVGFLLTLLGAVLGSTGWQRPDLLLSDAVLRNIVWEIRLPRTLGACAAGALLGLGGAVAQGLFRNPLADPYLLGSASGASLGVALALVAWGVSPVAMQWAQHLGLTGAAFGGAVVAVGLTLALAQGVQHTVRLLLAGVIVGVVLGALTSLVVLSAPQVMQTMQAFLLGSTSLVGWGACGVMAAVWAVSMALAWGMSPVLDALTLGEATARSLGLPLDRMRALLVVVLALSTGAAVAQTGLIAFVGLAAPHVVRSVLRLRQAPLLLLSSAMGAVLLMAADALARSLIAPRELPVGVLTAVLGGGYLLWLMRRAHPANAANPSTVDRA